MAEELKLKGLTPEKNGAATEREFRTPETKKRKVESPVKRVSFLETPEQFVCTPETAFSQMNSNMVEDDDDDDEVQLASPPKRTMIGHQDPQDNSVLLEKPNLTIEMDQSFDPEKAKAQVAALENRIQEMIHKGDDGTWTCKVCGKIITGRQAKGNMKQHVETHIEGMQHTCTACGKTYKNRNSLHTHISMKHRTTTPDYRYKKKVTGRKYGESDDDIQDQPDQVIIKQDYDDLD
jgi:hypothetical protein